MKTLRVFVVKRVKKNILVSKMVAEWAGLICHVT